MSGLLTLPHVLEDMQPTLLGLARQLSPIERMPFKKTQGDVSE